MRLTPRVAGFRLEYPAGFELECMAGFIGTRNQTLDFEQRSCQERHQCQTFTAIPCREGYLIELTH